MLRDVLKGVLCFIRSVENAILFYLIEDVFKEFEALPVSIDLSVESF